MASSNYLRELRSHADEAVDLAIDNVMSQEEKKKFIELLKKLNSALKTPPPRQNKKQEGKQHSLPAAKELFQKHILPKIRTNINKFLEL